MTTGNLQKRGQLPDGLGIPGDHNKKGKNLHSLLPIIPASHYSVGHSNSSGTYNPQSMEKSTLQKTILIDIKMAMPKQSM
jgi:hypothetical protein